MSDRLAAALATFGIDIDEAEILATVAIGVIRDDIVLKWMNGSIVDVKDVETYLNDRIRDFGVLTDTGDTTVEGFPGWEDNE